MWVVLPWRRSIGQWQTAMPETSETSSLTEQLQAWRAGSDSALVQVMDRVYADLKQIAARRLGQSGGHATLSPTELLHEALLSAMAAPMEFKNRAHFFATMSLAIRSILVDHARARMAHKRGGGEIRVTLTQVDAADESMVVDLLAIEQALNALEKLDARCGRILHLAYFAGLDRAEIADVVGVSIPTVDRDLKFARGWVNRALHESG
jgi:RNA polymerase sigma factor (TIGR02999 family)